MIIYSETTKSFLDKLIILTKEIIKDELDFPFLRKRILINSTYYPINFICFEHSKTLGFYDPKLFQIGINKTLMFKAQDHLLKNIIRHELAHFLCHVYFGDQCKAHGTEFRDIFTQYNWDKSFSKSTIQIEEFKSKENKESKIFEKVQKLLKLAESKNEFEAKLATKKANDLITKHNLEKRSISDETEDETYVIRIASFKKRSEIYDGIYEVISNFNVYPIFNQGRGGGYLEVVGSKVNVQIAEYTANFLINSILSLWKKTQKENPHLKGLVAKNSFIRSFCKSLSEELKKERSEIYSSKDLISLSSDLSLHISRAYPKLRLSYSKQRKNDSAASALGKKLGKKFKVKSGLSAAKEKLQISFTKK